MMTQEEVNELAYSIVGCAIEVHKELGPGLLESIYEICLIEELQSKGHIVTSQVSIPVIYKGKELDKKFVVDLIVDDCIIVELKAVEQMNPIFQAQLMSYLKLTGKPKGLLMNFNSPNIVSQLVPIVMDVFAKLPKS